MYNSWEIDKYHLLLGLRAGVLEVLPSFSKLRGLAGEAGASDLFVLYGF